MKTKIIQFILIFFILISTSYSINLNIEGQINEYSTLYSENISIKLNCTEDIRIQTPKGVRNIFYNNIKTTNTSFFISNCNSTNSISYELNSIEDLNNNRFRFERNFNNFNNLTYTFNLNIPLEFQIDENNSIPKKFEIISEPRYQKITFEPNELFVIYFDKISTEENQLSLIHLSDELTEINVILLLFCSFFLGLISTYIYMNQKIKKIPQNEVPSFILSSEEKNILNIIKDEPGINQKQIGIKLNFSKSRVSAFINDLEQKQLIKREKFGRSFKVYLNKKIV